MNYIDDKNNPLNKNQFIKFWAKKYDEYNPSSYSDKVYFHFIKQKKISSKKLLLLGAWKWNMISDLETNNMSFSIKNKKYWLKNGWSDSLTSKPKREYCIYKKLSTNVNLLKISNELGIINKLFYELLKMPKCGMVNSIFIIHILFPEDYPLYDQFVHYSMDFIYGNVGRSNLIRKSDRYTHFYEYHDGYRCFYNQLLGTNKSIDNIRIVDKALWCFGKFIMDSKGTKHNANVELC